VLSNRGKIFCDLQEQRSGIPEELEKHVPIKLTKLPVGDYRYKWWMVERKPDYQFIQDRNTKQLFDQIARLIEWSKKNNCIPCLISECDNKVDLKTQTVIEKMLRTMNKDIWVIRTYQKMGNENSTLSVILYYAEKIYKKKLEPGFNRPSGVRGKKNDKINFICGFSGIDEVKSRRLLKTYGSVMNVIKNHASWCNDVDGIGPVIQKKASELLHGKFRA